MFVCTKCKREVTTEGLFCPFCGAVAPQAGSEPGDPYVGQTVADKYLIHQLLGRGGMGQVYKATHLTLDRPVVLKLLNRSLLSDPSIVQRFHREARAASRLNHPNSITVIDFGQTEDGTLFMAMEFLPGRSLAKVIAEDFPIAPARIVKIGSQVLAALTEAHAQGILHRDLKPENVMVESRRDEADFVKVLDFGIAKLNEPGGEGPRLTQAGMVCGTPGYMSPEQARGEDLDARADLYAVGVILYEMITGQLPFDADTPLALVTKVLVEQPIAASARRPDLYIPPDLEGLVMRALSTDREARPASAEDMRRELQACAVPEAPAVRPTPAPYATVLLGAAEAPKPPSGIGRTALPPRPPTGGAPAPATRPSGGVKSPARPSGSVPGAAARPSASVKSPTAPPRAQTGATRPTGAPAEQAGSARSGPTMALGATPPPSTGSRPAAGRPATPPPTRPSEEEAVAEEEGVAGEEAVAGEEVVAGTAEAPPPPAAPRRPPTSPAARRETPKPAGPKKGKMPLIAGAAAGGVLVVGLVVYGVTRGGKPAPPAPSPAAVTTPSPVAPPPAAGAVTTPPATPTAPPQQPAPEAQPQPPPPVEAAPTPTPLQVEPPPAAPPAHRPAPGRKPRPERVAEQRPAPPRSNGDPIKIVKPELHSLKVPPASSGEGILAIVATPWAEVSVNGRVLGETPRELRVVAGTYHIRATHPTLGTTEQSVRVVAGRRNLYDAKLVGK